MISKPWLKSCILRELKYAHSKLSELTDGEKHAHEGDEEVNRLAPNLSPNQLFETVNEAKRVGILQVSLQIGFGIVLNGEPTHELVTSSSRRNLAKAQAHTLRRR